MNGAFLARRYMFKQKRRTLLTAFGIALAIALVCGTGVLFDSFRNMMMNVEIQARGNWHYDIGGIKDTASADVLIKNKAFEAGSVYSNDTYARFDANYDTGRYPDNYGYLQLFQGDSAYVDMSSLQYDMRAGRLPETPDEIVISLSSRQLFVNTPSLGDTLTLPVGTLVITPGDGNRKSDYSFTQTGMRTFTIVGFSDSYTGLERGYYAYTLPQLDSGAHSYTARVRLLPAADYRGTVMNAIEEAGLGNEPLSLTDNYGLIRYNMQGMEGETQMALLTTCGLLIAIILAMMMLVVRNTFAISIDEKMQQFGILRCLGASKRSIKSIVRSETLMLWGMAAPVGIVGALVAMQILFMVIHSLGGEALSMLTLHWSAWPFLLALGVSLVCVMLASASPARKCAKVSPVGAVRGDNTLRASAKRARGGRLLKHVLGFPGFMSARNMRRNPRKYRATVISVAGSIALFLVVSGFADGFRSSLDLYSGMDDMDIRISNYMPENTEEVDRTLRAMDSIGKLASYPTSVVKLEVPAEKVSRDALDMFEEAGETFNTNMDIEICFIDEAEFNELVFSGAAPSYEEFAKSGKAIMMQTVVMASSRTGIRAIPVCTYSTGDVIDVRKYEYSEDDGSLHTVVTEDTVTLEILGIAKASPWYCPQTGQIRLFMAEQNRAGIDITNYLFSIRAKDGRQDELSTAMKELQYKPELLGWNVFDVYNMVKENRTILQVMDIFLYGFTAVIILICSMNLLNTIKTNMHSRKREMCMLRAIGMSRRQMFKMLILECIWYAVLGTLLGLLIGVPLEMLLILSFSGVMTIEFAFSSTMLVQCILCMVVTCIVAILAGYGPIRSILKIPASEGIRAIE